MFEIMFLKKQTKQKTSKKKPNKQTKQKQKTNNNSIQLYDLLYLKIQILKHY